MFTFSEQGWVESDVELQLICNRVLFVQQLAAVCDVIAQLQVERLFAHDGGTLALQRLARALRVTLFRCVDDVMQVFLVDVRSKTGRVDGIGELTQSVFAVNEASKNRSSANDGQ